MATDAEIYREALRNAGNHLACWAQSAISRSGGRIGLASTPVTFTDADVLREWHEIKKIGEAMRSAHPTRGDFCPEGAIQPEPGAASLTKGASNGE